MGNPTPTINFPANFLSRKELTISLTIVGLSFAVRILYSLHYQINSDEPQHLHVIWGWYHGLLQYRDIFDNHMPLFHMLMTPLFSVLGERPSIIIWMRLAMLPLFAIIIFCIYVIGASVFSERVGLWAAVFTAVYPEWPMFIQFRPDILWAMCWFSCIAILVSGRLTIWRSAVAGLLAGLTFATSLKTSFLAVALASSIAATILLTLRSYHWSDQIFQLILKGCAFIICLLIPSAVLVAYFCAHGAADSMFYCVIKHNLVTPPKMQFRNLNFIIIVSFISLVGAVSFKQLTISDTKIVRKIFIVLLGGFSLATLKLWPIVAWYDYTVIFPGLLVGGTALIESGHRYIISALKPRHFSSLSQFLAIIMVTQLIAMVIFLPKHNFMVYNLQQWRDVLNLTDPDQTVMDLKGELIFRPRPFFYVIETFTSRRMKNGLLKDDIPEHIIASGTYVAIRYEHPQCRMPARTRHFIERNYISVGTLLVAGKMLERNPASNRMEFEIELPGQYSLVSSSGLATGLLDNNSIAQKFLLKPGRHFFQPDTKENKFALVWSQAIERNFWPVKIKKTPTPAIF